MKLIISSLKLIGALLIGLTLINCWGSGNSSNTLKSPNADRYGWSSPESRVETDNIIPKECGFTTKNCECKLSKTNPTCSLAIHISKLGPLGYITLDKNQLPAWLKVDTHGYKQELRDQHDMKITIEAPVGTVLGAPTTSLPPTPLPIRIAGDKGAGEYPLIDLKVSFDPGA